MFLAEGSSWSREEDARGDEATARFGRATDTVKPASSFLLWEARPRRVGTSRWRVVLEVWPCAREAICGNYFVRI